MTEEKTNQAQETVQEQQIQLPENVRVTVAPLQVSEIREYFDNKDLFYILNYSKSKIKGMQFLVYTTNLDLPCNVVFDWPMPYEEYSTLMKAYFAQNSITRMVGMQVMAAQLLLYAKGFRGEQIPYNIPVEEEYMEKFVEENKETISRWLHFIDSTQVFALQSIGELRKHYKPRDVFEVVDDRTYVGSNVAGLYNVPEFIGTYFCASEYNMSYFVTQFEEYIFNGQHLSVYFNKPRNLAAILFQGFAAGEFTADECTSALFKIGVFSEKMNLAEYKYDPNKPPSSQHPLLNKSLEQETVQDGQSVGSESIAGVPVPPKPES